VFDCGYVLGTWDKIGSEGDTDLFFDGAFAYGEGDSWNYYWSSGWGWWDCTNSALSDPSPGNEKACYCLWSEDYYYEIVT